MRFLALLIVVTAASVPAASSQQKNVYQRPTSVTATITGSPRLRDGSFTGQGTSGICGELPGMAAITGEGAFVIEFTGAQQSPGSVYSVAFGSKQFVRGATSSNLFTLNVSVVTADGGKPPAYVLNTDQRKPGESGLATLTQKGQTTTLSVRGEEGMKEKINLLVTCG
jgi:hypothetical protein